MNTSNIYALGISILEGLSTQKPPEQVEDFEYHYENYTAAQTAKQNVKVAEQNFEEVCKALELLQSNLAHSQNNKEKLKKKIDATELKKIELEEALIRALQNLDAAKNKLTPEQLEAFDEECYSSYDESSEPSEEEVEPRDSTSFHGINMPTGINQVDGAQNTQFYMNRSSIEPTLNPDDFKTDQLVMLSGKYGRGIKRLAGNQPSYRCEFPDGTTKDLPLTSELKVNTAENGLDRIGIVPVTEGNKTLLIGCIPFTGGLHGKADTKAKNMSASKTTIHIEAYPIELKSAKRNRPT